MLLYNFKQFTVSHLPDFTQIICSEFHLLFCCHSYKRVVTPRRAGTAVLLCWLVSIIVGLTPMLGWNNLQQLRKNGSLKNDTLVVCKFETVISMDYMVYFNFFGWVLPPLLLMLAIYVEIFYMIHKQLNKKVRPSSSRDGQIKDCVNTTFLN